VREREMKRGRERGGRVSDEERRREREIEREGGTGRGDRHCNKNTPTG
jgi:hypothetical protein